MAAKICPERASISLNQVSRLKKKGPALKKQIQYLRKIGLFWPACTTSQAAGERATSGGHARERGVQAQHWLFHIDVGLATMGTHLLVWPGSSAAAASTAAAPTAEEVREAGARAELRPLFELDAELLRSFSLDEA